MMRTFQAPAELLLRRDSTAAILGGMLGAFCFLMLWGATPLNPFALDWIIQPYGTDPSFNVIGAAKFLQEPWSWPPGLIKGLIYPIPTSVLYIDGIPLAALIAKLFGTFTEDIFQYFGIWGLFCMIMQGGISAIIIQTRSKNAIISAICSGFFIFSPFILAKMFSHTSMSGQWVILLSILLIWRRSSPFVIKHYVTLWASLMAVSVAVISYMTPMVAGLLILSILLQFEKNGPFTSSILLAKTLILSAFACAFTFWMCGGFLPDLSASGAGYGDAPLNLAQLINPGYSSFILQGIPLHPSPFGAGEGASWLGLGVMIGIIYCLIYGIYHILNTSSLHKLAPFWIISFLFIAFAATNKIAFGPWLIFDYPLPDFAQRLGSAFRTSARFVWPVWYLIVIAILDRLADFNIRVPARLLVIATLLTIQISDNLKFIETVTLPFRHPQTPAPLASSFWRDMGRVGKHLFVVPFIGRIQARHDIWGYLAYQAVIQRMTINYFWLGRYPLGLIDREMGEKTRQLHDGTIGATDIVVLQWPAILIGPDVHPSINSFFIDGHLVFSKIDLTSISTDAVPIQIARLTLPQYLSQLDADPRKRLILMSARGDGAAKLAPASRALMEALGIRPDFVGKQDYTFAAAAMERTPLLLETEEKKQIRASGTLPLMGAAKHNSTAFSISVSPIHAPLPVQKLGQEECVGIYFGMTICVFDAETGKLMEFAAFPLHEALLPGVLATTRIAP